MEIRIYHENDKMLVQLSGRVVLDECDRLKAAVVPRIAPGIANVNLDLSQVDFIDSAGLGVLVGMKVSSNKSRARLALISPSKQVGDILLVSKLDSIFDIVTGNEAKSIIDTLAKPENLMTGDDGSPKPKSTAPTFQAPPTASGVGSTTVAASAADSNLPPREQIDKFCKAAVEYMRNRDYENAADCYKKALDVDPNYLPAHNNLAIVYEKIPKWQEMAVKQWERVLQLATSRGDQKHIERAQKHLESLQPR